MNHFLNKRKTLAVAVLGASTLLVACGGSSSGGSSAGTDSPDTEAGVMTLSGAVAVGAAVSGATVSVQCESGPAVASVVSSSAGYYQVEVEQGSLPCALRVTGGNLPAGTSALYSWLAASNNSATSARVNITPLTDLALSFAVLATSGETLASWFAEPNGWTELDGNLGAALQTVHSGLAAAGYQLPANWSATSLMAPFTEVFTPSATPADGTLDALLEELQAAISGGVGSYDALLASLMSGGEFPQPKEDEGGGSGGETVTGAVAAATFGGVANPTQDAYLSTLSASWPVAIYQVPAGKESWYGEGRLIIGGSVTNWTMELRGADDSVISSMTAQGAFTSALTPYSQLDLGVTLVNSPGQVFINKGTGVENYMNAFFSWDSGLIEGGAGGSGEVLFRNSLVAYGNTVPAVFDDLAGSWSATTSVYCSGPYGAATQVTNTAVITSDGKITLDGSSQLCGASLPLTFSWGGLNDFIKASTVNDGGVKIELDVASMVNASNGKVQIEVTAENSISRISAFLPELLELKNPVQE